MTTQQNDTTTASVGRTWGGFFFLAIALLVIGLDLSIADVTLPSIVTDLGIDADSATLIITIFMVVAASFMVLMGKVADLVGPKRSLLAGCLVFAIGSTITGLANSFPALMAGRAIQGFVLALAIPASLSLLNQSFPSGRNRALAFSIWTAVIGSAMALGPLIGGALSTFASWRWAFLINVPIMVVAFLGVLFLEREIPGRPHQGKFDVLGSVLLVLGLGLVVFGLQEAANLGWWSATGDTWLGGTASWPLSISPVPIMLLLGLTLLLLFARWEISLQRTERESVLEFSLFRVATFSWGTSAAAAMTAGVFGLLMLIPLYAQFVLDQDPLASGLTLVPLGIGMAMGGPIITRVKIPPVKASVLCLIIQPVAVVALIPLISASGQGWWLALPLFVEGFAWGAAYALLVSLLLADVPKDISGVAGGTQVAARLLFGALGGALITSLLLGSVAQQMKQVSESDLTTQQQQEITSLYEFKNQLSTPTTNSGATAAQAREIEEFDQVIEATKDDMVTGLRLAIGLAGLFALLGALFGLGLARQTKRERTTTAD